MLRDLLARCNFLLRSRAFVVAEPPILNDEREANAGRRRLRLHLRAANAWAVAARFHRVPCRSAEPSPARRKMGQSDSGVTGSIQSGAPCRN